MEYPSIEVVQGAINFDDKELILKWFSDLPLAQTRHESKVVSMIINYMVNNGLIKLEGDE